MSILLLSLANAIKTEPLAECICALTNDPTDKANQIWAKLVPSVNKICPSNTYPVTNSLAELRALLVDCANNFDLVNCLCLETMTSLGSPPLTPE